LPDLISWIDPDGAEYLFDGSWSTFMVNPGVKGRFGAPFSYLEQLLPLEHGSQVTNIQVAPGEVTLPWDAYMTSEAQMRSWFDAASRAFNPLRGRGKLRATRQDGSGIVREFPCYLKSGFDQLEEAVTNGFAANAPRGVLVFRGGPFWEDIVPVTLTLNTGGATGSWFPVTFPWRFADSSVFAKTTITNPGHVEAWPTIYVQGPGSGFVITDDTTDDYLSVNYTVPDGDAIQIETRTPGRKRIYLASSGADLMSYTTGSMFPFAVGDNQVTIEFAGASSASLVNVSFNPRYYNP
jgi:hypothetical protein